MALESTINTATARHRGAGGSTPVLIAASRRETMGADENAETVRRGYEAFNTADMKTLTEIFDESASWHTPGRGSLAGDHKGREATFAYFGRLGQETGGTFQGQVAALACRRSRPRGRHSSQQR